MEEWEEEVIITNLDKLASKTTCSSEFLNKFQALKIFSQGDVDDLSLPEDTPSTKSSKFYRKIVTRKLHFTTLMTVLKETKQSGARSILKTAITKQRYSHLIGISPVTYDKTQKLGKGSNGTTVFKGRFGDRQVAVKRLDADNEPDKMVTKEVENLKKCDGHENIVRYWGTSFKENFILIVLELCDMTLQDWLPEKPIKISPVEALRQITVGLEWLHSKRIVHRDLKPENILLTSDPIRAKISDFGLSRNIADERSYVSSMGGGTQGWVAPEILQKVDSGENPAKYKFTLESDIFSMGCIYYYVLKDGKQHPFGGHVMRDANILKGEHTVDIRSISYAIAENLQFITFMISKDPQTRPSCSTLLTYPIFVTRMERRKISVNRDSLLDTSEKSTKTVNLHRTASDLSLKNEIKTQAILATYYIQSIQQKKINNFLDELKHMDLKTKIKKLVELVNSEDLVVIRKVLEVVGNWKQVKITEVCDCKQRSLLHAAVAYRDYDVVEYLMFEQRFENVLAKPVFNNIALFCIVDIHEVETEKFEQKCKILELLFTKRPELVQCRNTDDETPLHIACGLEFGNGKQIEFIQLLLKYNADVNAKSHSSQIYDRTGILDIQERHEDDYYYWPYGSLAMHRDEKKNFTVLHCLVMQRPFPVNVMEIVKLLIENEANIDEGDVDGLTFFDRASYTFTDSQLYHELIAYLDSSGRGKSLNRTPNYFTLSTLGYAVSSPNFETLRDTLEIFKFNGLDFNAIYYRDGCSMLHFAIESGRTAEFLQTLFSLGTDWNILNNKNETALHVAAKFQNLSALRLFMSLDFDVNAMNREGATPLHNAFLGWWHGSEIPTDHMVVEELLTRGADVHAKDNNETLPIDLAKERNKDRKLEWCDAPPYVETRTVELLETFMSKKQTK